MKAHRWIILLSILLCVASVFLACFFNFTKAKLDLIDADFWINLLLGTSASCLIVIVTTFVNYIDLREKALNTIITHIVKTQTHYEDVRLLVNPRNANAFNGDIPAYKEEKLFSEVKQLIVNVLWIPRSERASWYTSVIKPPNAIFSTHLQRVEFDYVKTCSDLLKVCYDYWDCYCKRQRNSNERSAEDSRFESGCLTELIRFFYREIDFITYSNVYLDLVSAKKNR